MTASEESTRRSDLRLFDTLSSTVRTFTPLGKTVTLYVCGVTPYDTTHLGHAFTYVSFDVLIRYLQYLGYPVRYIQNVTDIDDPLFDKARELGVSYRDLATEQTALYLHDMQSLNVLPAESYPHASREIPGMIAMIERLLESGHAYQVEEYVYFSVASAPAFGELSKYDRATMIELARERGGDPDDPRRRDPLDFVLWRPTRPDEPKEPSPWGPGLPGWHLECSEMSVKFLGDRIDLHGGGADLIFPHHECEIVQSEAATGEKPFVGYWLHTGMVFMDGEKMSKSLGNMVFARDLVPQFGADAVRVYISGCHYRSELYYDHAAMAEAAQRAGRLARAAAGRDGDGPEDHLAGYRLAFEERMNDDLDTPGAIEALEALASAIEGGSSPVGGVALLRELAGVLGLQLAAQA